jgi:GntR family transcriptional regulator
MVFRLNPSSGVPVYLQLMEQVKHAVDTGALRPGDQLPTIRKLAEDLVVNPNTVVRAYRDLEHEGLVELKQGSGAFVRGSVTRSTRITKRAQGVMQSAVERLVASGLTEDEIRRLFENELTSSISDKVAEGHHA